MKIYIHRVVIAIAAVMIGALGPLAIAAQEDGSAGNNLAGVWEAIGVPPESDCKTGDPIGAPINISYTFHQGGTMYQEDTLSIDRYRTTGSGLWKRTSGKNYTYLFFHYAFDPTGTFIFTVKGRSNLKLSTDNNSLTERGTFDLIDPTGSIVYTGCFDGTSHRVTF